nr:putative ORF1 [Marmot picobirnavirus]
MLTEILLLLVKGGIIMTANQIAYWNYLENARANRAKEIENNRANLAKEAETNRSNLANETVLFERNAETRRSNLESEGLRGLELRQRMREGREQERHNKQTERWQLINTAVNFIPNTLKGIGSLL